ncbi:hypothetical protein RhiirC2_773335 [Rhizophagus irregularis]|uniref:Uncharacterized protein n=1 Tax=Rhizophagus irregularis TaxID=588596 RepID=A0A2N1NP47_9GLOM|nr:hypothetical protein RhiirC2_773335 [Rhizophagus irregularis]
MDELNHVKAKENDEDTDDKDDINYPAQNNDVKWKLNIIFKDNLSCPFWYNK